MMLGKHGSGQVVEPPAAGATIEALMMVLRVLRGALRTGDTVRPAKFADGSEPIGVVDEVGAS